MSCQAGEISLTELLNNEIAALYMSEQCSDIILYIEGQNIPAHRSIISARCEYLKTYFTNDLNEPNQTKFELNVPLEPFQVLLKYFYTGQISLSKIKNLETLIQTLNLVEEYCLFYLKTHFENYLMEIFTVENTFQLLEVAKTYELKELLNLIDTKADQILASESFKTIHKDLLEAILTRDTFNSSSELLTFHAVEEWSKHANQNIETVIHLVKLAWIPFEELLRIGISGKLTADKIFDAIGKRMASKPTTLSEIEKFGQLLLEKNENVATSKYNVRTIEGDFEYGDRLKYRHMIGDDSVIIIELGQIFIINHLKMLLLLKHSGYYIEISTDQKKWERIIDYSSYKCHSMQNLYFPSKFVKYVKIVGTNSDKPVKTNIFNVQFFEVKTFEAYYCRENIPEIRNGFVVLNEAVTYMIYWSKNRYGICLTQPYYIGLIRFYIDGGNLNRKYKFFIQTSLNDLGTWDKWDLEKIADKRDEFVNGWQTFRFTLRPIVYIRVTPTNCNHTNEALDTFTLKNFECHFESTV